MLKTYCSGGMAELVELEGGLLVTPWHPIWFEGSYVGSKQTSAGWTFPCQVPGAAAELRACEAVYSFAVMQLSDQKQGQRELSAADGARAGVMMINGVRCVTLGHGISDGVAHHPYFGTGAVIQDLEATWGWRAGECDKWPG